MVASKNIFKKTSYVLLIVSAILMVCTDVWAAANNSKPAMVNRIDFIAGDKGTSSLIIGTTAEVQYDLQLESDNKMKLVLENTVIPTYRRRALVTSNFDSAINRILPVQSENGSQAYVLIDLRENVPYKINKTADNITVNFEAPAMKASAAVSAEDFTPSVIMAEAKPGNVITGSISAPQRTATGIPQSAMPQDTTINYGTTKKVYTGTPIALDFYETDIRNVVRILQEVSGRNFAVDRDVQGSVTLSFRKPVPWDQVLDLILTMNQLSYVDEGGIIRIARAQTLIREAEDRTIAVNRANALRDAETKSTAFIPVYYAKATELAEAHIAPWLDELRDSLENSTGNSNIGTDITVSADNRLNMIVVNAPERIVEQVRGIVQHLDRVTPQVLIEARIVEANSTFSRELGFNWGDIKIGGFNFLGGNLDLTLAANNLPDTFGAEGGGSLGFSFSKLTGTTFEILDAKIMAAETEGLTNILSAPRILTLNSEKASIKQGMEVPYQERDDAGGASIAFKEVDLLLEVTPQITLDNRITLEVFITKNEVLSASTSDEPAIATNEARTKFMVDNGDTVVIGGILKSTRSNNEAGIPGLRDLSLLGWLFNSERIVENKNELLIFMTTKIITLENKNSSL